MNCKTCPAASLLDNTCRMRPPMAFAIPVGPNQIQAGFFPPLPDNGNGWCYQHPERNKQGASWCTMS